MWLCGCRLFCFTLLFHVLFKYLKKMIHRFITEEKLLGFGVAGSSGFKYKSIERWIQEKNKE